MKSPRQEQDRVSMTARLDHIRLAIPRHSKVVGEGTKAKIHWCIDDGWYKGDEVKDCLMAFMRLANDDSPEAVIEFAERFGVLGVHSNGQIGDPARSPGLPSTVVEDGKRWHTEPVAAWVTYARNARAVLILVEGLRRHSPSQGPFSAAQYLKTNKLSEDTPLDNLPDSLLAFGANYSTHRLVQNLDRLADEGLETQQKWLGHYLTQLWIGRSGLRPCVRWDAEVPTIDLDMTTFLGQSNQDGLWSPFALFSVLCAQLAAATTNAGRYSQCSECGNIFMFKGRKPRRDRARYCSSQCRDSGERRRKRDFAARRRA